MAIVLCGFVDGAAGTGQGMLVQYGPTLLVDIGFDQNRQASDQGLPDLAVKGVRALVDTGATTSCIDSGLAMQLNLPIIDRQRIGGVGGVHEVNMHLAHIVIPGLHKYIDGAFAGVDLAAGGQPHVALIGRTFLQHFTLIYEGRTGSVSITDEPPSAPTLIGDDDLDRAAKADFESRPHNLPEGRIPRWELQPDHIKDAHRKLAAKAT